MLAALFLAAALHSPTPVPDPLEPLLATVTVGGLCCEEGRHGRLLVGAGEIVARRADGVLLVLTARHVIDEIAKPHVYVREGDEPGTPFATLWQSRPGRPLDVIALAPDVDLALVAFRPKRFDEYAVATLGDEASPDSGEVIGDPNSAVWMTSPFRLLAASSGTYIVDCHTCGPGDSGGGVFDEQGHLAGIVVRQRVDPGTGAQFQVVALSKLRSFLAAYRPAPVAGVWSRFDDWTYPKGPLVAR